MAWSPLLHAQDMIAVLIHDLNSADLNVRIRAAAALGDLGAEAKPAIPELIKALGANETALQHELILTFGRLGPHAAEAVPALTSLIGRGNATLLLRASAIDSLRQIGPAARPAAAELKKLLDVPRPVISASAAWALLTLEPENLELQGKLLTELIEGFSAKKGVARADFAQALSEVGAPAVPELIKVLESQDEAAIPYACDALAGMEKMDARPAIPSLLKLLKSDNPRIRNHAMMALGEIRGMFRVVVPELVLRLDDRFPMLRTQAAKSLANYGPQARPAVDRLAQLLVEGTNSQVRAACAFALGEIGSTASAAVPALNTALDDAEGSVTLNAAEALGKIGAASVPVLIERVADPKMRAIAANVLGDIGPAAKDAVGPLTKALADEDPQARQEVALALAAIGPDAKPATAELMKMLQNESEPARAAAAFALSNLGAAEALPLLKQTVNSTDAVLSLASARALWRLSPGNTNNLRQSVPALANLLSNQDAGLRFEAAQLLAEIGPPAAAAVPALLQTLKDQDRDVQLESLAALAEIGPESNVAVPQLVPLLGHSDQDLRTSAAYALGRIGSAANSSQAQLRKLLASDNPYEKTMAAWALVRIAPDAGIVATAIPLLIQSLADPNSDLRLDAAIALGEIGSGSAEAKAALEAARKDKDADLRNAVIAALKRIGN